MSGFMRRNAFPQALMQAATAKQLHNIRITVQENNYLRIKVLLGTIAKGFPLSVQKKSKGTSYLEDLLVRRERNAKDYVTPLVSLGIKTPRARHN